MHEAGRDGELAVEIDGLVPGPELAEDHAGEQARITARCRQTALGGEDDLVAGLGEQAPRHGDLGGVEVGVGQRQQHLHRNSLAICAATSAGRS
jgi:hypothetical protein